MDLNKFVGCKNGMDMLYLQAKFCGHLQMSFSRLCFSCFDVNLNIGLKRCFQQFLEEEASMTPEII